MENQIEIQRSFIDLNTIYDKKFESENYEIETIRLSHCEVRLDSINNRSMAWLSYGLKADFDYIRLVRKGDCMTKGTMMSDTAMERNTNKDFIQRANGDVLIFGLGLGLIVFPLLDDESIKSITIVELYQDLIDIVAPKIKERDKSNKVKVVQGDCYKYDLPKGDKFDTIYLDIWMDITTEDYRHHKELIKKYRKNLNKENPNAFIDAWLNDYYKGQIRREKNNPYGF